MSKYLLFFACCMLLSANSVTGQMAVETNVWHWAQKLGGSGWDIPNGIVADSKNNVYVGGAFVGDIKGGETQLHSNGNKDLYLAKLKDSGRFEWLKSFGGTGYDKLTCMAVSGKDEIYIGGVMAGEVSFGKKKVTDFGQNGLFVACFDTKGNNRWVCPITCSKTATGYLIEVNDHGDICFGGIFTDTISVGEFKFGSKGKSDVFVVTISKEGKVKNAGQYGGNGKETLSAMTDLGDGKRLLAVNFEQPFVNAGEESVHAGGGTKKTYLLSTAPDGGIDWAKTWSGQSYCEIKGLTTTNDGGASLCGNFSGILLYDSVVVKSTGATDFFAAELDSLGNVAWFRHFGSKFNDQVSGIVRNRIGGVMLTGAFCDSLKLGTCVLAAEKGATASFAIQLDRRGNVLWADKIGSGKGQNFGTCSAIDRDGNLVLAGSFNLDFNSPAGRYESIGGEDVYVAKYKNCGKPDTLITGRTFICPGSVATLSVDKKYSEVVWNDTVFGTRPIDIDKPGFYWVRVQDKSGCIYRDTVRILPAPTMVYSIGNDTSLLVGGSLLLKGPPEMVGYTWQGVKGERCYLATDEDGQPGPKTFFLETEDAYGCVAGDTLVIDFYNRPSSLGSLANEKSLETYPNPVHDVLRWRLDIDGETTFDLEISDLGGNVYARERVHRYMPRAEMAENVASLVPGTYMLRLIGEGLTISKVFIKK